MITPLPSAAIADACVRLQLPLRAAGLVPLIVNRMIAGRVLPARHYGSVDVFFEALQRARAGDILVIDNSGRTDEACIGDLTTLEAMHHKVAAIALDGCHRDTAALAALGLPIWTRGRYPVGPRAARRRPSDALTSAIIGGFSVTAKDVVVLDDDGAVFVAATDVRRVWTLAKRIQRTEADQALRAHDGEPLCEQLQIRKYLATKAKDPKRTFRTHLEGLGKAIEV